MKSPTPKEFCSRMTSSTHGNGLLRLSHAKAKRSAVNKACGRQELLFVYLSAEQKEQKMGSGKFDVVSPSRPGGCKQPLARHGARHIDVVIPSPPVLSSGPPPLWAGHTVPPPPPPPVPRRFDGHNPPKPKDPHFGICEQFLRKRREWNNGR